MHADDALRPSGRIGDLGDRQRGGVRGEDRVRTADAIELGEDGALQLELLEDRFDDEIAVGQLGQLRRQRQARERSLPLVLGQAALLDAACQVAVDRGPPALCELLAHLPADGVVAGLHADLRDSGSHRAEADDAHPANLHGPRSYGEDPAPVARPVGMKHIVIAALVVVAFFGALTELVRGRRPLLVSPAF